MQGSKCRVACFPRRAGTSLKGAPPMLRQRRKDPIKNNSSFHFLFNYPNISPWEDT